MCDRTDSPAFYEERIRLLEAEGREARAENQQLRGEIERRDSVLDWLTENNPAALELCPYKLAATSLDGTPSEDA